MSIRRLTFLCATPALAALTCNEAARADLLIEVDKAAQRMTLTVDGHEVYKWAVATWGIDYDTTNGTTPRCPMQSSSRRLATRSMAPTSSARSAMPCRTAACGCRWPTPRRYGGC